MAKVTSVVVKYIVIIFLLIDLRFRNLTAHRLMFIIKIRYIFFQESPYIDKTMVSIADLSRAHAKEYSENPEMTINFTLSALH